MSEGIFAGLKVIDCATYIAAPAAATTLSDFGADVIKVEPIEGGDAFRHAWKGPGVPQSEWNYNWILESRNKRSIALDLKQEAAREALYALVRQADVFITNYPPPVRQRLKVDYEHLKALNPRLIYAGFTAYGEAGPEAGKTGFDSTAYWARSGLMDLVKPDPESAPARSLPGMGDHPSSMGFYGAIVTALYRREKTGKGGMVNSSLLANGLWANGCAVQARLCGAEVFGRPAREQSANACTNTYRCKDGRWFMLTLINEQKQWGPLVHALGHDELRRNSLFATPESRKAHARALTALFDEIFATKTLAEWRPLLDAAGITFGLVGIVADLDDDPQVREAGMVVKMGNAPIETLMSPFNLDGETKVTPRMPPELGEHGAEILREAGFDAAAIATMKATKALG